MKSRLSASVILWLGLALSAGAQNNDPLPELRALLTTGRAAEARTKLAALRDSYRAKHDAELETICLLFLASADEAAGDLPAARIHFEEAAKAFRARNDYFDAWIALAAAAVLETTVNNYPAAIHDQEQALSMLHEAREHGDLRVCVPCLKIYASLIGKSGPEVDIIASQPQLLPMLLPMFDPMAHDQFASVLIEAGQLDQADLQLQKAAAESASVMGLFDGLIATHIGDLRKLQGRLDDAMASYVKAMKVPKLLPGVPMPVDSDDVSILNKLAGLEVTRGRTDDALAWNDQALTKVRADSNRKREASVLQHRGDILKEGGRYDESERTLEQALNLAREVPDESEEAFIESSIGALHMSRGQYGTAASHLEKSIALYRKLDDVYLESSVWTNLITIYLLTGDLANADRLLSAGYRLAAKSEFRLAGSLVETMQCARDFYAGSASAEELRDAFERLFQAPGIGGVLDAGTIQIIRGQVAFQGGGPMPDFPPASVLSRDLCSFPYVFEGKLLADRGDFAGAREVWLKALKVNGSGDLAVAYKALIGATYVREQRSDLALQWFTDAADAMEAPMDDLRVDNLLSSFLGSPRRFYFDVAIEILLQNDRPAAAFDYAERARARAFLQSVGNTRLKPAAHADPVLVHDAEALRAQFASLRGTDLAQAQRRYETLISRMKSSSPEYAALTPVEPISIEDVQRGLPGNTTLISYYVSLFGTDAWVLDRSGAQHVRLKMDEAGLRRIACWADGFAHITEARSVRPLPVPSRCGGGTAMTSEEAFDSLVGPLLPMIHNRRLILIPHNVLHYVPFAALRNPRTRRYLVEDYTITYAPSASVLQLLRGRETPLRKKVLVLGDPEAASPQGQLEGARDEARDVADAFGTQAKLGGDAKESLLYSMHDVGLLHIAAHGLYDADNPSFSRIQLAPGDGRDGNLEVHEVLSDLDLSGVKLVVLSACRSGVGQRNGGDEIVGLTRAFLYAGAPSVIATLWDINDDASRVLMNAFYRGFLSGAPVADALRGAQLEMLRSGHYADPTYWGAFSLTGDPQERWRH